MLLPHGTRSTLLTNTGFTGRSSPSGPSATHYPSSRPPRESPDRTLRPSRGTPLTGCGLSQRRAQDRPCCGHLSSPSPLGPSRVLWQELALCVLEDQAHLADDGLPLGGVDRVCKHTAHGVPVTATVVRTTFPTKQIMLVLFRGLHTQTSDAASYPHDVRIRL